MTAVYLDYNATAPVKPAVIEAVAAALATTGNPSSVHSFGRTARKLVEDARDAVAALVGAEASRIVFTAGGTEANNLALRGCGRPALIVSAIEHPAILRTAETSGAHVVTLGVDADGVVDLDALDAALDAHGADALISVMLANNETGVIQPTAAIAERAHAAGALFHCDAVQGPGRVAVSMEALGADMISLSAHKFGGPKGIGALVLGPDVEVDPIITGGGQERGRRGGTENVGGIAGFGKAAALARDDLARASEIAAMRDSLEDQITALEPAVRIYSRGAARLPNTSSLTMPGVQSETQVMGLDLAGVAVSAGSACSSGKVEPSHVLRALGADDAEGGCAIRVSLGWASEPSDVERFVGAWRALYGGLTNRWKDGVSAAVG